MKKLISQPHRFFFGLVPVCIVLAFVFFKDLIEFEYYGGFIEAPLKYIYFFSALFFTLIGFNYYSVHWANKPLIKGLTRAHILLQCTALILLISRNHWTWLAGDETQNESTTAVFGSPNFIFFMAFLIFLLATFIHLINFFISLFRKSK
ncbi:hypothetical protein GCM10011416_20890 [Polaribacter pacificus]|uniref:Uncharacterized protein n=1 Tax=Polaribacter pacificus TaxID=1775173 RepID=A0A917I0P5_9FLAO|nr:hypothetical protein [Polaribacter pacificus]GGH01922.1 hypothetical protein GCM10011416_20890 [Polaribacter pacificus]